METLYWIVGIVIVALGAYFLYRFFRAKHDEDVVLDHPPKFVPQSDLTPTDEAYHYEKQLDLSSKPSSSLIVTDTKYTPLESKPRNSRYTYKSPNDDTSTPAIMSAVPILIDSDPTPSRDEYSPSYSSYSPRSSYEPSSSSSYSGSTFPSGDSSFSGSGGSTFSDSGSSFSSSSSDSGSSSSSSSSCSSD